MLPQNMAILRLLCSIIILLNFDDILVLEATASPTFLKSNCSNNITFPRNSSYYSNLRNLLSSLALKIDLKTHTNPLFSDITVNPRENSENTVYGQYICQGDYSEVECSVCVFNAATHLPLNCSMSISGYIWYEGCTLSFSNVSFQFNDVNHQFLNLVWFEERNTILMAVNETNSMVAFIVKTMRELVEQVAKFDNDVAEIQSSSLGFKYFGTNEVKFVISDRVNITLYEMVQCSPDLSVRDCSKCLNWAVNKLVNHTKGGLGGRVGLLNCFIRYETYRFYKLIEDLDLFPAPPLNSPSTTSQGSRRIKVVIAITIPVSMVLALGIIGIGARKTISNKALVFGTGDGDGDFQVIESYQYQISDINAATDDFSDNNKIGQGGFGSVYKGILQSGQLIAVKKLFLRLGQMEEEFKNEVEVVAKLQHRNLVRLLGYCLAKDAKLLVFEYVPNKSLDKVLFASDVQLDWLTRFKIIVGIARGLLYLHEESRLRIVHRDLKPGNILLDEEMNPKIADFGLARIFGLNKTPRVATNTTSRQNYGVDPTHQSTRGGGGTPGYMAPECAERRQFSVKTDVYSFGVLILEIITGKRNRLFHQTGLAEDLLSYAWMKWEAGTALELMDDPVRSSRAYLNEEMQQQALTCIHMGLLCVQRDAKARPTMGTIVHKLNYPSDNSLPPPQQPATIDYPTSSLSFSSSLNECSFSDMDFPR